MEANNRIEQRHFDLDEVQSMMRLFKICIDSKIQFSVVPLPESIKDARHTGWRVSFPVA